MKEKLYYCSDLKNVNVIAGQIWQECSKNKIKKIAFFGELGSGKTTFIKSFCKILGYKDNVDSPSFTIVNEYLLENTLMIYHLDLYRLNSQNEVLEAGISEIIDDQQNFVFIEWPDLIKDILQDDFAKLFVKMINENERELSLHF